MKKTRADFRTRDNFSVPGGHTQQNDIARLTVERIEAVKLKVTVSGASCRWYRLATESVK